MDETPIRARDAEQLLLGKKSLGNDVVEQVAEIARDAINPNSDLHASSDYRRHLAYTMTRRTLKKVWEKTQQREGDSND